MQDKIEDKAKVKINPLKFFVILLVLSYILGLFFNVNILFYSSVNFIGFFFVLGSVFIFILSVKMFFLHKENLPPSTPTFKIIKTGIYSYSRNPIYLSFVCFQLGMFLLFENIYYLISSLILFLWLNLRVIVAEEDYLEKKFNDEYYRYKNNVHRWFFF